jgi:DNA adenine methylase
MIRFSSKGRFNVPFNHKPQRFSRAYVTKVVNQVRSVGRLCQVSEWEFLCQDFRDSFSQIEQSDFVYCDPPYLGRHTDYFNAWGENEEMELFGLLSKCGVRFILSTWHSNQHRRNPYIDRFWSSFYIVTRDHFYHVGAKEKNRKPMLEALVMNYTPTIDRGESVEEYLQPKLFDPQVGLGTESWEWPRNRRARD